MKNYLFIWLGIYGILSGCANCPEKQELEVCRSNLGTSEHQNQATKAKLEISERTVSSGESALATCQQEKDTVVQEKNTVVQEKNTVVQEKNTVVQEKNTVVEEKNAVENELETSERMKTELQTNLQKCEQETRHNSCLDACQNEFQSALLDCQDDVKDVAAPIVRDKAMNECMKNEGFPKWKNSCPERCGK